MREVIGALERPPESFILVDESHGCATIVIPRARLPLPVRLAAGVAVVAVLTFMLSGIAIFTLNSSSPVVHVLDGPGFAGMSWYWKLFYVTGWFIMSILAVYALTILFKPLTRRERILFTRDSLILAETVFAKPRLITLPYATIRNFSIRKDPTGMQESQLLVRLNTTSSDMQIDEIEIAQLTTEAEKEWLASVMNVFLRGHC